MGRPGGSASAGLRRDVERLRNRPRRRSASTQPSMRCAPRTQKRSLKRVPALVLTLGVELVVAFVISEYAQSDVFRRYPLFVLSARQCPVWEYWIASPPGNVREVAVGMHDEKDGRKRSICVSIWPEFLSSSVLSAKDRPAAWNNIVRLVHAIRLSIVVTTQCVVYFRTATQGRSVCLGALRGYYGQPRATCFQSHGFRSDCYGRSDGDCGTGRHWDLC